MKLAKAYGNAKVWPKPGSIAVTDFVLWRVYNPLPS